MADPNLTMALFGLLSAGVAGAVYLVRGQRIERRLARIPVTAIGDARPGAIVRISGKVSFGKRSAQAPFTDRRCAFYTATVDGGSDGWGVLKREHEGADFFVDDSSGRAHVEVKLAEGVLVEDFLYVATADGGQPTRAMENFCGEQLSALRKTLRYREGVVELDAQVTVWGQVRHEPDLAAGSYREVGKRVVLVAPRNARLVISNLPDLITPAGRR